MQQYAYTYNIHPDADEKKFLMACSFVEKKFQGIKKDDVMVDVDGSMVMHYYLDNNSIIVYDDYYIGAVYINSDIELEGIENELM